MKKLFCYLATFAMVAAVGVSCDKKDDGGNGNGGNNDPVNVRIKSLTNYGDGWSTGKYEYTYNADGTVQKVTNAEEQLTYNFAYSGATVTITDAEGATLYTLTKGANGYVETYKDEWDTKTFTYNAAGYMTKVVSNDEDASNITIENDCIKTWSRFQEGAERIKDQTYTTQDNVAGIFSIYSEKAVSRWLFETGMFGKASVKLVSTSKWQDSEIAATYTYAKDANGCVIKETKTYDGSPEYADYEWDEFE